MAKKCPDCLLCLDIVWIMPRRFFHCWLCDTYYDFIDGKMTVVDVEKEMNIHMEQLKSVVKEENKTNERFS